MNQYPWNNAWTITRNYFHSNLCSHHQTASDNKDTRQNMYSRCDEVTSSHQVVWGMSLAESWLRGSKRVLSRPRSAKNITNTWKYKLVSLLVIVASLGVQDRPWVAAGNTRPMIGRRALVRSGGSEWSSASPCLSWPRNGHALAKAGERRVKIN